MVTSDADGRATRTSFTESMNVPALKHGCSAWCLGALIAFPHVIRTPHPRRARARLLPRTGCRTAETNFRAVRLRRARGAAFWRRTACVSSSELCLSTTNVQKLDFCPNKCPSVRLVECASRRGCGTSLVIFAFDMDECAQPPNMNE